MSALAFQFVGNGHSVEPLVGSFLGFDDQLPLRWVGQGPALVSLDCHGLPSHVLHLLLHSSMLASSAC